MPCVVVIFNHSVFDRIDYPTVEGTLYENQKLIHLLNMQAGDDEIIGDRIGIWAVSYTHLTLPTIITV